jgi:hypothetical protein
MNKFERFKHKLAFSTESLSWCPGAQEWIDISEIEEEELVFSSSYDTYCPIWFCRSHEDCLLCEYYHTPPKTLK